VININDKLIKVLNPTIAEKLISLGFKYVLESINSETVYAFFVSEDLLRYLHENYETKDFFYNNMLHF